jgi:hypothetical protein
VLLRQQPQEVTQFLPGARFPVGVFIMMNAGKFVTARLADSNVWCYGVLKRGLKGGRMQVITMNSDGSIGETVVCMQAGYRVCEADNSSDRAIIRFMKAIEQLFEVPSRAVDAMLRTVPGSYGSACR